MSQFLVLRELNNLISDLVEPFESAALLNGEGQILGMKYETLPDIGTFAPVVQTALKYFPLKEGEVVLTNDPYSGGTLLSAMTLVTSFQIAEQNYHFAIRTRFKPRLVGAQKLDDEGLRIPPTPIASERKINEAILSAISSHPLAPAGLIERLPAKLNLIWRQIDLFKKWAERNPHLLHKNLQKTYLQETRERILRKVHELPHGDHRVDLQFDTGEAIRLHIELQPGEIHFDFAGTSSSKRLFLTDLATYGTCVGAFISFLGEDFPLNDGLFSLINVTTPQGCFLNAKYPSPVFEGMAEGSSMVASLVVQSLAVITSARPTGAPAAIPTVLSFEFPPGKVYLDILAGGTGATPENNGLDGHYVWSLNKPQTSVEEIERLYPLRILQSGLRQSSGGKGKFAGGNGVIRETLVHQDCTLRWILGYQNNQIKGIKGHGCGLPAELIIKKADGEQISIRDGRGFINLSAGDKVLASSAGGSGFGKASDAK